MQLERMMDSRNQTGVGIENVFAGGAAKRYGNMIGDRVLSIDGTTIRTTIQMSKMVTSFEPYKKIKIRLERDNLIKTIDVVLTPKFIDEGVMLPRYADSENLGRFASTHNSGFPEAIQHDTDLYPRQCGGPLYDISGKAIGLNIARAARITSYAIPAPAVLRVFAELKAKGANPVELKKAG